VKNAVAMSWLMSAALFGVVGFLSNPAYYLWAVVTLVFLAMACVWSKRRTTRRVLLVGYGVAAIYGFIIGRLFFGAGQLTNGGVVAVFLAMLPISYLVWRLYKAEAAAA